MADLTSKQQRELQNRLTLSYYESVRVMDEAHGISLVRHRESGRFYVMKKMQIYNASVYHYLKGHPVPHTPRIYEVVEEEQGLTVIEEYFSAQTLADLLRKEGPFSLKLSVLIMAKLCDILSWLHGHDPDFPIVHRDIKPSNVMLKDDGEVILLDMNVAKWYDRDESEDTHFLGTPEYAAPEQLGYGASSPQTDLYLMGALFNELLTGKLVREMHAPEPAWSVISKCMKLSPELRPDSARELKRELLQLVSVQEQSASGREAEIKKGGGTSGSDGSAELSARELHQLRSEGYLLPGFRGNSHMVKILASCGYALLIWTVLWVDNTALTGLANWLIRPVRLMIFMGIVLMWGDYRNVQACLGLNRVKRRTDRFLLLVLYTGLLLLLWFMLAMLIGGFGLRA